MKEWILVCLLLLTVACQTRQTKTDFAPRFIPVETPVLPIAEGQSYQFGYLEVLEDRSRTDGRTIRLPVFWFKSRSSNPQPDPIIYTVGGPGYSSMPSAQYMKYYRYLDDRDFIIIEQRGTQYAQPPLDCLEWSLAVTKANQPNVPSSTVNQLYTEAAIACRTRLLSQGIDLNAYNTAAIAADIADLRKALGIDRYNFLSISYSTKIAQVLLRDYPDGIRSVVMDSPLPLEVSYDEESVHNLLEAVHKVLASCAEDPDCGESFPDIELRLFNFLEKLTDNPISVPVSNPENGSQVQFELRGKEVFEILASSAASNPAALPNEINKILQGDYSTLQENLAVCWEPPGKGTGIGMRLCVWCSEEFPFSSQSRIEQETNRYRQIKGLSPAVFEAAVCSVWQVKPQPMLENQPVKSLVPVLLLSGEFDFETPPKWANEMLKHLPNGFHLTFPGWSHTVTTNWANPCAMEVAHSFFQNPGSAPEVACFRELTRNEFLTK